MWLRWIHERWSLQQKRNFLFISRAIACSVSFLGVLGVLIKDGGGLLDVVVLVVVVALLGPVSTGSLAGFQLPVVIVVISGAEVVVVAYCASVLPPGASVTGDVVVVLVVASPLERTRPAVTPAATSTPTAKEAANAFLAANPPAAAAAPSDILDVLCYDWESCVSLS